MIILQIPRVLERYRAGNNCIQLRGQTVREVLEELRVASPALYQCICNESGAVRQHIHLFVNNDLILYRSGLDTPLCPGDVVSVFQAVSGG
jgi:sulfur-carrier protein